jgi:hypothetical protein
MTAVLATQPYRPLAAEAAGPTPPRPAKPQAGRAAEAGVVVTVSRATRERLEAARAVRDAADTLLEERVRDLYEAAFRDLKQYPESLAAKREDVTLSREECLEASRALEAREKAAFGMYRAGGPLYDPIKYIRAYIEYYDSLSPEGQMSDRYRGTREQAVAISQRWMRERGEPAADLTEFQNPVLRLFEDLGLVRFGVEDPDGFRDRVAARLEPLYDSPTNGERFRREGAAILGRFDALLAAIAAARGGDREAPYRFDALAADPAALDGFLAYADGLRAAAA